MFAENPWNIERHPVTKITQDEGGGGGRSVPETSSGPSIRAAAGERRGCREHAVSSNLLASNGPPEISMHRRHLQNSLTSMLRARILRDCARDYSTIDESSDSHDRRVTHHYAQLSLSSEREQRGIYVDVGITYPDFSQRLE